MHDQLNLFQGCSPKILTGGGGGGGFMRGDRALPKRKCLIFGRSLKTRFPIIYVYIHAGFNRKKT